MEMTQEENYQHEVGRAKLLKEMVYDPLKRDWENYRAVQLGQDAMFLKTIASMSAGAFGLSFSFISFLIPFQTAGHQKILVIGWTLFASAIVLVLFCYLLNSFVHSKRLDDIELNIQEGYAGEPFTERKRWYYGVTIPAIEFLAFMGFIGGMGCLVSFVLMNLK